MSTQLLIDLLKLLVAGLVGFWLSVGRDEKQYQTRIVDEARLRWNNDIAALKDFLNLVFLETARVGPHGANKTDKKT